MADGKAAVVIGATGLVGTELVRQLLEDPRFSEVTVLARRATGVAHPRLREHLVDLGAGGAWEALVRGDALLSALGTTLKAAGSEAAQWAIDHRADGRSATAAVHFARNGVDYLAEPEDAESANRALAMDEESTP